MNGQEPPHVQKRKLEYPSATANSSVRKTSNQSIVFFLSDVRRLVSAAPVVTITKELNAQCNNVAMNSPGFAVQGGEDSLGIPLLENI